MNMTTGAEMRRGFRPALLVAGLVLALSAGIATPSGAATTSVRPRIPQLTKPFVAASTIGPYIIRNYHSGRCLEDHGFSRAHIQIDQWDCVGSPGHRQSNELWYLDLDSTGVFFELRNAFSGQCMNIRGNSTANNAPIIQYTCGAFVNEVFFRFFDAHVPSGYRFIGTINGPTVKAFNISGAATGNGGKLIQWSVVDLSNEWFTFTR
jgi:Ricin-type beta-trefoil lectin domain-like